MAGQGRQFAAYRQLAELAARRCKLPEATAEAAAEDPAAREERDGLWMDLQERLRDPQTYTLDDVVAWGVEQGAELARTGLHRLRRRLLADRRRLRQRAQLAREMVEAMGDGAEANALAAGRAVAAQLMLDQLQALPAGALDGLSPTGILKLVQTVGFLSKAHVETEILQRKLGELNAAAKAAVDREAARSDDRRLTREDVYRILDDVMRGDAA